MPFDSVIPSMEPSEVPTGSSLPSSRPTLVPSEIPSLTIVDVDECTFVKLDFDARGDGSPLLGGEFVKYEWRDSYGLIVTASSLLGGVTPNDMPRVFDTQTLDRVVQSGNLNVLSPNQLCLGERQGLALGYAGRPGQPGENCKPKGKGLVIQSANYSLPWASGAVGVINFDFDPPVEKLGSIGLLNVVSDSDFIVVSTMSGKETVPIEGLGVNAALDVNIDAFNVRSVAVHIHGQRVITHLTFCNSKEGNDRQLLVREPPRQSPSSSYILSDGGKSALKVEQIVRIKMDQCKIEDAEGMIEILNHSASDVTFVAHPVSVREHGMQGLSWLAVDYPTPNFGLNCVSKMTPSSKDSIVATADCNDGVAVVDVYAFSEGLLGQLDGGSVIPPSACRMPSDDINLKETCHYRFHLECSSSPAKRIEPNKSVSSLRRRFRELWN
jgi:hypothetical protein